MSRPQASRAERNKPSLDGSRKPGCGVGARIANRGAIAASTPAPATRDNRPKLTIDDARAIRTRRAQGETLQSLANAFSVVLGTVDHICQGRTFKSLGGRVIVRPRRPHKSQRFSRCCHCYTPLPVSGAATRGFCDPCVNQIAPSIWRAGDPTEALPANLHKYLQG